jgi:hypothetical protein
MLVTKKKNNNTCLMKNYDKEDMEGKSKEIMHFKNKKFDSMYFQKL